MGVGGWGLAGRGGAWRVRVWGRGGAWRVGVGGGAWRVGVGGGAWRVRVGVRVGVGLGG